MSEKLINDIASDIYDNFEWDFEEANRTLYEMNKLNPERSRIDEIREILKNHLIKGD